MIGYFLHNFSGYSGASKQAKLLAENIEHEVVFFNFGDRVENNPKVVNIPSSFFLQFFYITYFVLKFKINTFHFHGSFNVSLVISFLLNKRVILKTTLLGDDDFDSFSTKRNWIVKFFFIKNIYKNITLSKRVYEINSKYLPVQKLMLIPNGVSIGPCIELNSKETNSFCFVGLVCKRKRTFESIEYFLQNFSHLPDAKFYIVGPYENVKNNFEFSQEYVDLCMQLVESSEHKNKITFIGHVAPIEAQNIMKRCKALLFFSSKEGMPNVVLESLAQNCVPITNWLDGVSAEIFENKVSGFIIDSQEECIDISDIDLMVYNRKPFKLMKDKFDIKVIAKSYNKLYL
ncbi:glycosyltransferase family 4 protein [Shewanella sp. Arc9-LZ]|uniref:glycosyltransferase family 4 protein n=1 Tax=Shewanella sp. Arc9-LZ TaxID=2698686 RepID=UPI00137BF46A|nr:glycosyltransferase family 4 protein [Shewanella sp. Arc9-LZ]QHS14346.1 glycosyltransferase family 4 protein [Shewanella sp. Arc9-LZ]